MSNGKEFTIPKARLKKATVYTDGSCWPNPGPGGWAAIVFFGKAVLPFELSGSCHKTTNNRMELFGIISALEFLARQGNYNVNIFVDSKYVYDAVIEPDGDSVPRLFQWMNNNWITATGTRAANTDLWKRFFTAVSSHIVTWNYVPGHAGDKWNERADELAGIARKEQLNPAKDAEVEESERAVASYDKRKYKKQPIEFFVASSCDATTGIGAYSAMLRYGLAKKVISKALSETTVHELQKLAIIEAVNSVKVNTPIVIYTHDGSLANAIGKGVIAYSHGSKNEGIDYDLGQACANAVIDVVYIKKNDLYDSPDSLVEMKKESGKVRRAYKKSIG